ncbi:MAG: hypothetical protein NVSMB51_14120 [Solirubrobacteraceae bacterium]
MLLAGTLGLCASLLIACGSNAKLIPAGNAGPLQSDFDAVASAVSSGDCSGAASAVQKAQQDLAALPAGTDPALRQRLQQGVDALGRRAPTQCTQSTQSTDTTTSAPTTTTTASTDTTPTTTTTTATTTTDTKPTTSTSTTPTTSTSTTPVPDNGGGTPAPGLSGGGAGSGQ